eukprot:3753095-Amphidinium_carterae.1
MVSTASSVTRKSQPGNLPTTDTWVKTRTVAKAGDREPPPQKKIAGNQNPHHASVRHSGMGGWEHQTATRA